MIDLDSFSDCSRDVVMATKFRAKFGYMGSFGKATFQNGSKMFNGNILSTPRASLKKIGQITLEFTRVINSPFWMRRQNRPLLPNISTTTGPIFTIVSALIVACMRITKMT